MSKSWISNHSEPHGKYDKLYNPVKSINDYDMEESEEVFPEKFKLYK